MKIVHMADLHLGFRAYRARNAAGVNVREADVMQAFSRAVTKITTIQDLAAVVVAGDVFDTPAVSNYVMTGAIRGFKRIAEVAPVYAVGGNHDAPRVAGKGNPLKVVEEAVDGFFAYVDEPTLVRGSESGLLIGAFPHAPGFDFGGWVRQGWVDRELRDARHKVLVIHAAIEDRAGKILYARMGGGSIHADAMKLDRWSYVAAGDFHEMTELAPNAYYSGPLCSVNAGPWSTARLAKGFLVHDLETGETRLQEIGDERAVIDAPEIDAELADPEALTLAMVGVLTRAPEGSIVRVRVRNAGRALREQLDWRAIQDAIGLHLHVATQFKDKEEDETGSDTGQLKGETLAGRVERFVDEQWTPEAGVERADVKATALDALGEERG